MKLFILIHVCITTKPIKSHNSLKKNLNYRILIIAMPKRGSRRKKTKTHQNAIPDGARPLLDNDDLGKDIPRSLVVRTSKVTSNIQDLVSDLRKLMSPSTASNLREKRFVTLYSTKKSLDTRYLLLLQIIQLQ